MMERSSKSPRSIWRSNFWRLAAIFVIFIIGLQAVQSKKLANDNDIIFDDSPLDPPEGWNSRHKLAIDNDDDDSHWLWSNVNRIKRSIHNMWQSPESKSHTKRGIWDLFAETPTNSGKGASVVETSTEYKTSISAESEEQNDHSNDLETLNKSEDDDESENEIDGSGTHEPELTNEVHNGKLEQFFRLILTVEEIWSPNFKDASTNEYKAKAQEIERSLEEYYRKENSNDNTIVARVVQIRLPAPNRMFTISVMTDIKSAKPITYNDLDVVIKNAIKNRALGEFTIKEDGYKLAAVKETDQVKASEIEIVTSAPETDDGDVYVGNDRIDTPIDGFGDEDIEIDYEGSTSDSTNNIEHGFTSSSTTEFPHEDKCRGDESVPCPKNPHIRICEVQFCDRISDCPDEEDEDPSKCPADCESNEFACDISRCIPNSKQCDGMHDCHDLTDEMDCPTEPNPTTSACAFRCKDGSCVPQEMVCDGAEDCADGEEEADCRSCSQHEFQCNDGLCIDLIKRCNGFSDCPDGSDEEYSLCSEIAIDQKQPNEIVTVGPGFTPAPPLDQCLDDEFECMYDSQCIDLSQRCDGAYDCIDMSDEDDCINIAYFVCENNRTIPIEKKCNGKYDCRYVAPKNPFDVSDERDCSKACRNDMFRCTNGYCIDGKRQCDGISDCNDRSDETNCPKSVEMHCDRSEFSCNDQRKQCLPRSAVCDGLSDCDNGSDENDSMCKCSSTQFKCITGGGCVDLSKKCDSRKDCFDGSDESKSACAANAGANTATCQLNEIMCVSDGRCIEAYKYCNGIVDCSDASDEELCSDDNEICSSGTEFQCDQTKCILSSQKCDGIVDCFDSTDEENCDNVHEVPCQTHEFKCNNGLCIDSEAQCDGHKDCLDGSDELKCPSCHSGAFQCHNGDCILAAQRCDRIQDCSDLSDEIHCAYPCQLHEFRCSDGLCVKKDHLCDGIRHCADGTDELNKNCNDDSKGTDNKIIEATDRPTETCGVNEWRCNNNQCINNDFLCDGIKDCTDSSDEGIVCNNHVTTVCSEYEFLCDDDCHPISIRCDGIEDCADGRDEEHCVEQITITPTIPPEYPSNTKPPFRCPEYKCPNEDVCFGDSDRCNGRWECTDGYDERGCPPRETVCGANEFKCDDTVCLTNAKKCDRVSDCRDGSDEKNCPAGCRPGEWQCSNGDCIHMSAYCDGRIDCHDYSDERYCQTQRPDSNINGGDGNGQPPESHRLDLHTYPNNQTIKERYIREGLEVVFQCRDEGPIRARVRWTLPDGRSLPPGSKDVNGRLEIPNIRTDHSGDFICEAIGFSPSTPGARVAVHLNVERRDPIYDRPPSACSIYEATCMSGDCIRKSAICDGVADCRDGSDESSCSFADRCQPNEFKCNNRKCVLKTWRCDGENDCEDNSDEENCAANVVGSYCSASQYQCGDGRQCIPKSFECDTHNDCIDGSDEVGCVAPTVAQSPPPLVNLLPGETFNISCRAVGVPVPLVVWRLNWGHVPEKCTSTSHDGYGVLTCPNVEVRDSGAYSCETINSVGTRFAVPDTILTVSGNGDLCGNGLFNNRASRPDECINCFCFGVTTKCNSADLFTYSLLPPTTSLTVLGVVGPWDGSRQISINEFDKHDLIATRHGVQLRLTELPLSGELPYYSLPEDYLGNQLKSYGGSFRYDVEYSGSGNLNNAPDVILMGNGYTLVYRINSHPEDGQRVSVAVEFMPGHWYTVEGRLAAREEIMMALANVQYLLIKLQYIDRVQREVEILNIVMDSAGTSDLGLGSASLVEECRCPVGYAGLSCESCTNGYTRQQSGAWLGRCVRDEEPCKPGTYGDPLRKIPCKPCPCPSAGGNNFARTCYLGPNGEPVCNCERGYTGQRCERCEIGFIGNPLLPGDRCVPEPVIQPPRPPRCDPRGTYQQLPDGRCECKGYVTGIRCDQCASQSFFLNSRSATGCIDCFCTGVSKVCTSSSLFRDTVQAIFTPNRHEFTLISDYENPNEIEKDIVSFNNEVSFRGFGDEPVFFWRLPSRFAGNKITSYGGHLNYSIRYVPTQGGLMSRNNAPDVVIRSLNEFTILHYRRDEIAPSVTQSYAAPILEEYWQRIDGTPVDRANLLMTLADVSDIFIKATYTTTTDEAALTQVSLDTASSHNTGSSVRAAEVEQCQCPLGHQGTSCEDCAPGYRRTEIGLFLGRCEPCQCNGHSDECDAETGVCHNCRDNTEGNYCELCANGFEGDATRGTTSDCQHISGSGSIATCPANVVGYGCDQCRQGTYNLDPNNILGCTECFCSGTTRSCTASRLYRQLIPVVIFNDKFALTNRIGELQSSEEPELDIANNTYINRISDGNTYYWSLPPRILGNQLRSYGGYLTFTIENEAWGTYIPDHDIIIRGNGLTLIWIRGDPNEIHTKARLKETEWQYIDQNGAHIASRADLMTVLSNLEAILIRATLKEGVSKAKLSDVALDTAVEQNTGLEIVKDVEICRCPEGYTGTSCETCDHFYYRDMNNRSAGLLGTCNRCPCENADLCSLHSGGRVVCHCRPGYIGDRCTDYETVQPTDAPAPTQPTITVIISSPVIQIVDVGETIRLPCTAFNVVKKIPITVTWYKQDGRLPASSYQEEGMLTISSAQHSDSGVYVCQAKSGDDTAEQKVTVTVGGNVPGKPRTQLRPAYVDVVEYTPVDVECVAQSSLPVTYEWRRLDGELSPDAYIQDGWLRFNQVRQSDGGNYQCLARNAYGDDTSLLYVYVRESNPTPAPVPIRQVSIQPSNFSGDTGDAIVLTCRNTINVYATLVWTKSGLQTLPPHIEVRDGVLTIQNARVEDSGRYICTSSPSPDTVEPQSITEYADVSIVTVDSGRQQPPIMKPLNELYNVVQGQDFTLACEASGNPYPRITWKKIYEEHLGLNVQQNGNVLRILNAQPDNRGIYQCIAESNGLMADVSTVIEIEPREAPTIEIYPRESQRIRIGEQAMLSCRTISGIPTPTVVWARRDRSPLSHRVEEKYAGTIVISNITFAEGGEYECRASNIGGEVSQTTSIHVIQAPIISIEPNVPELTITEGDELKLECDAEGLPAPSVKWFTPQPRTDLDAAVFFSSSLNPRGVIHKYNADHNDEGIYTCRAENEAGEDQKYITVIVQPKRGDVGSHDVDEILDQRSSYPNYRPSETVYPPDDVKKYKAALGDRVTLECQISNHNEPTSWRRIDGRPLPGNSYVSGGFLILENIGKDAAGLYECIAQTPQGEFPLATTELVVVELPTISLYPAMPLTVKMGDEVIVYCNATGSEPIEINWHQEDYRPFPANVRATHNYLQFSQITLNNAGRYYCSAANEHGNVTKVAEVLVSHNEVPQQPHVPYGRVQEVREGDTIALDCHENSTPGARFHWRRELSNIPSNAQHDGNRLILHRIRSEDTGRYICQKVEPNGKVTLNYLDVVLKQTRPTEPLAPYVKLEPAHSLLHPGDSIIVDCKSSSEGSIVSWKREGGRRLPYNFRQQGNQLIITNAQTNDAGRYICVCQTPSGHEYESEYLLNIEVPPVRNEVKPAQVEYATAGSDVVLHCKPDRYTTKYHWSRQQGHFATESDVASSDLRLDNVQAKDAGTYICTASSGSYSVEMPITLVVTGTLPHFPQAPNSYLVFPKLEDSYMKFNFEVTFNPERPNGLILYNGQTRKEGNFIALSLNDGYPEFRYDFGAGTVTVRAEKPIEMKKWHTIRVNKVRKEGYLLVDDQHPVSFPQTSRLGVELLENLYIGSVPNFNDIVPSAASPLEGFVGCISRLILKDREIQLKQDAIFAEGTTSCETCANDVCQNDGVCLETQTDQGFTCVCKTGFTGKTCAVEGLSCSAGICGTGRCENTEFGIDCYCPLNKTGDRCQYTEHLDESNLSFKDGSFAAYKTPKSSKLNIRFNVRPETTEDSVILYVAESNHANGDFAAVLIKEKHYEFRFNTGGRIRPVIIRSAEEVEPNKWTSILVGRRHGEGFLQVGDAPQVTVKTSGPARAMYLKTHLYIGGYDKRILLSKNVEVSRGLDGCVSGLEVSGEKIDLVKSILDGENIQNCGDTNEIAAKSNEPVNQQECRPGYSGLTCNTISDRCLALDPCENNGICENKFDGYVCNCPMHYSGDNCQYDSPIEFHSQFKGDGFIEVNGSALAKSPNEKDVTMALLFSTHEPNGLLAWHGQPKGEAYNGQDFIALAIVDGYLKFSFRLDGEESSITSNARVDDGIRHMAVIRRNANRATLQLDHLSEYGEIKMGSRDYSYLPGNLFIGGAPDMHTFTGSRYSNGFNGCINIIEGDDARAINLQQNAIGGTNVLPCADKQDEKENIVDVAV